MSQRQAERSGRRVGPRDVIDRRQPPSVRPGEGQRRRSGGQRRSHNPGKNAVTIGRSDSLDEHHDAHSEQRGE
ncbi:Uncharacterised protein [Mycobacteroides abscessus subsp. abscessus]|nr:Uncharacterised protein [Mycobacteroides abscessus subsp. abscessus]